MKFVGFFLSSLLLFSASLASATTRIAFLELYDRHGRLVQYEPGGRFAHTAIQFDDIGDKWLNAYPGEGVAIVTWEDLQDRGVIAEVIEIPQTVRLSQVKPYMGLPFDFWYSWTDDALYCTELIAKLLNIPTHPMRFNKQVWPKNYWPLEGTPGLSPDGLYKWAQQQIQ
ncbi:YiiX/YebB-like N1pC/P60 family cysteine hydrolase [Bdellovibrio sp. 22V]|uniref:YiiX/YebB-like N1pC/P60 family cysteine hydrolase n=1 Tax=Bdellovibrio sp. 22V TaxID=3044166 RepID=UPI0025430B44|nr:YiiX/YebB-like N1pC/P60 family cysteine hydrolase [Bdellovibrio sp. 22V]WII71803.1 YiiX/YebB-like N1pC/P60 family cysteine hydrolase [Bdellovibrio sp. 22V]